MLKVNQYGWKKKLASSAYDINIWGNSFFGDDVHSDGVTAFQVVFRTINVHDHPVTA
jgi:hypothetical protein